MTLGRMLTLPLWIALGLAQLVIAPVLLVAVMWWLAPLGWTVIAVLVALLYLLCVRWAARASHGGVVRMVATRAVTRSEIRAAAREARRARDDDEFDGVTAAGPVTGEVQR
ncbi:hypothetical protein [Saccharothrix obliqua]|uniref:hypothetical protein n=1 Tax=Saccharothrix obliqua TaxID=2861747 RepID=UPI001C5F221A|nr:hypothetical protein [Saccharothrix obliqua]MBW4717419.1 hypothetical protein [Saccharothrix obliqua]